MPTSPVVGLFVSDIHWSENPPVARSIEEDWIEVQRGYVQQLLDLQTECRGVPIFIVGDLFDKWNSSPFLISSVISWIGRREDIYAIPGNHDTPNHNYKDLPRSAYWTLVEAGVIKHLCPGGTHSIGSVTISPFPFGFEVTPPNKGNGLCLEVAMIHDFIWTKDTGHKDASESKRFGQWAPKLKGYDAAFFGDNHKSFDLKTKAGCMVTNCGTFMRRHSDEKESVPAVSKLHSNGHVSYRPLNTKKDKFLDAKDHVVGLESVLNLDLTDLIEELNTARGERLDYIKVAIRLMEKEKFSDETRIVILRALGVGRT